MILVSLADALDHLHIGAGEDDAKVQMCLDAAISAASDFLDFDLRAVSSSSDAVYVKSPDSINQAILMICETLYDGRAAGQGELLKPWSTEWMLLNPSRKVGL